MKPLNNEQAEKLANDQDFHKGDSVLWDAWYLNQPQKGTLTGFYFLNDKLCGIIDNDGIIPLTRIQKILW